MGWVPVRNSAAMGQNFQTGQVGSKNMFDVGYFRVGSVVAHYLG